MAESKLRAGIYQHPDVPQSFRVYAANVVRHFPSQGIEVIPFESKNDMPRTADVLWDIRSGGGNPPLDFMLGGPPLVITVHGFAPISLSGWEYFRSINGMLMSGHHARKKLQKWGQLKDAVATLIAVSNFTKAEAMRLTGMPAEKIAVCPHGVNTEFFNPEPGITHKNYFLHISNDEPRKNVARIVSAFRRLRKIHDVELLLKLPADRARRYQGIDGVRVIGGMLSTEKLASLYRRALGFVFPSLYEGFGLPILEAMASGCPVITSNTSACPEVAGNAALVVDPRDGDAIFGAMSALCIEKKTCDQLATAGLRRVALFNWQNSSACHAKVLHAASGSN